MLRARGRKYSPKKGPEAGSIRTKIRSQLGILHNTGNDIKIKGWLKADKAEDEEGRMMYVVGM